MQKCGVGWGETISRFHVPAIKASDAVENLLPVQSWRYHFRAPQPKNYKMHGSWCNPVSSRAQAAVHCATIQWRQGNESIDLLVIYDSIFCHIYMRRLPFSSYSRHIPIPKNAPPPHFSCLQRACSKQWVLTPELGNRQSHGFLETKNATVQQVLMLQIGLVLTVSFSLTASAATFNWTHVASMWRNKCRELISVRWLFVTEWQPNDFPWRSQ